MRKDILIAWLLIFVAATPLYSEAQFKFFKKKPVKDSVKEIKKTPYEKLLTDKKSESHYGDFLSIHKTDGKIYVEIPLKNFDKDILVAATLSSLSNPALGTIGFKNSNLLHTKFVKKDSVVMLELVNSNVLYDTTDAALSKSIRLNNTNASILSYKMHSFNKDNSAVVVDMTSFFLKENKFFPLFSGAINGFSVSPSLKDDLSYVYAIKSFEDNVSVKSEISYILNLSAPGRAPVENYPATFRITYSFVKLPEATMTPRASDTRIGVFQTQKYILDKRTNEMQSTGFVKRWRVEPSDTTAFKAGKLSEPIKPIIFYVDNTFPESWKSPIKNGILRWNDAFEKIGFKNTVQVKDFPTNDSTFDADNLKYSCIRYVPTTEENAMGPSWIDPRTGEIINASTFIYNNVITLIANWRFVQTSQIDTSVRKGILPQKLLDESLEYVVAHEIGHTLGFMHNMAASSAYPVDSLRSASFTKKYGTTPSIMDYARYNYIAQPQDKGVVLTPPFLGPYDYFLVEWAYKVFPELNKDYEKESKALEALIVSRESDSLYRYVMQQFGDRRYDPSAVEEDLGDNPIKAGDYGFKNLQYITSNFDNWVKDDEDSKRKIRLYNELAMQAYRYVSNVNMNIGGIYTNQSRESSEIPRYKVVNKKEQRQSVIWLLDKAVNFSSFKNERLEQKLYAANKPFNMIQSVIQKMAIGNISRVSLSYYLDSSSYSPLNYCDDVYKKVFEKTIAGKESLTDAEIQLQQAYVSYLSPVIKNAARPPVSGSFLQSPQEFFDITTNDIDSFSKSAGVEHHHVTCNHHLDNVQQGFKYYIGFGDGYGVPADIWMQTMDNSLSYMLYYAEKAKDQLEKAARQTRNSNLKMHYQFMLKKLKDAVE